jgi:hypothetical protein
MKLRDLELPDLPVDVLVEDLDLELRLLVGGVRREQPDRRVRGADAERREIASPWSGRKSDEPPELNGEFSARRACLFSVQRAVDSRSPSGAGT